MFPMRQPDQRAINLMILTMPITLAARLNYKQPLPNLAYHSDARDNLDILLDSYPLYVAPESATPRPSSEVELRPGRYFHFLHPLIVAHLENVVRVTDAAEIARLFNTSQDNASDRLYELTVLGKLRKMRYRHDGADNLCTLIDRQLFIADIPHGERNDRITELRAKGLGYEVIGKAYDISADTVRRLCKAWPVQRAELLAMPTTGI